MEPCRVSARQQEPQEQVGVPRSQVPGNLDFHRWQCISWFSVDIYPIYFYLYIYIHTRYVYTYYMYVDLMCRTVDILMYSRDLSEEKCGR